MAIIEEFGGGGTTSNVCSISPADELQVLNNLISRVADIERFLSRLVGADVYANNLSELARDLGNVLNGTIMLPNSTASWAGTGGSIPVPDGFSGSVLSGNVITTWTDGVVSFQVIGNQGVTTGGGATSMAVFQSDGGTSFPMTLNWTTIESQSFAVNNTTSIEVADGLYLLTLAGAGAITRSGTLTAATQVFASVGSFSGNNTVGFGGYWEASEVSTSRRYVQGAMACRFPDGIGDSTIVGSVTKVGTATVTFIPVILGIIRLGA